MFATVSKSIIEMKIKINTITSAYTMHGLFMCKQSSVRIALLDNWETCHKGWTYIWNVSFQVQEYVHYSQ